jgi:hypothetical protein
MSTFYILWCNGNTSNAFDRHKLQKSQGIPLILLIDATAKTMQARMLKLHTRTQQTPALIFNSMVYYTCNSGVCDRALKKRSRVENVTFFCCLNIFTTASYGQNNAL